MNKMVKCKACGKEIAKSAKICPGCGKRQHMSFWARLGILVVAVIAIAGIANAAGSNSKTDPGKTYKVGESFKTDNLEITITSIDKRTSVVGVDASEGAVYLAVAYKYKNIGNTAISGFSSRVEIKLMAPDGTEYDSDSAASMGYAVEIGANEKVISDLNPGITVKGGDVFEVAKDKLKVAGWKLNVEGNIVSFKF
jgi:RNA polymerase subunit RPABC4/transcription elongation factor Spt4